MGDTLKLAQLSVLIPRPINKIIDKLIEDGYFPSKSEFCRFAIVEFVLRLQEI